jgi:putative ABC transport system ATP-binding protein
MAIGVGHAFAAQRRRHVCQQNMLTRLRRDRVGFVFQAFNLMPSLTVTQNIALPLRLDGRRPRRAEVREVTTPRVNVPRASKRPAERSKQKRSRGS